MSRCAKKQRFRTLQAGRVEGCKKEKGSHEGKGVERQEKLGMFLITGCDRTRQNGPKNGGAGITYGKGPGKRKERRKKKEMKKNCSGEEGHPRPGRKIMGEAEETTWR